ncbi:MAG: hypothetical protein IJW53_01730 [Clostridia bacterium]|nr:hypothetical protein [Clostridia bacterium]
MKNKFLRVLALILVMSSLLSMFAIFANAEESESTEGETEDTEENEITLVYNRHFGEGWGVPNGMDMVDQGSTGSTLFVIDSEETADFETNYFWRLELNSSDNDYAQLNFGANQNIGTVFEFDVKSDDICNFSNVVSIGTKGTSSDTRTNFCLIRVVDNQVYLMEGGEPAFTLTNSWTRIQIICDYTYEVHTEEEIEAMPDEASKDKARVDNANTFLMYLYYGPADGSSEPVLYTGKPLTIVGKSGKGLQMARFQSTGLDKPDNYGTSICFDNMKVYDGTNQITEITPDMGYGTLVDAGAVKTENIEGGSGSAAIDLSTVLSMKIGVDYCYVNKEKKPIATAEDGTVYGAPVKIDGKVMISLDKVLEYIGLPYYIQPDGKTIAISTGLSATNIVVGKDSANVGGNVVALTAAPGYITDADGNSYIAIVLDDVEKLFPGYYSDYDDMGYMTVSKTPDLLDRNVNLSAMVSVMKEFVFEYYTPESIYNDVKEHTNGFQHPYILANGEQIETMYNEYQALEAKRLAGTLIENTEEYWMWVHYQRIINSGESYYQHYAKRDANGTYETFAGVLTDEEYEIDRGRSRGTSSLNQPYLNASGYDVGGRSDIANRTTRLEGMAFAYVLTKDVKYLQLCYEVSVILGGWTHWGPGHFLNCADSSNDFAVYYDWTYNGYVELAASGVKRPDGSEYDVAVLAEILARQGVHEGYYSTVNKTSDHLSPVVGTGGGYYSARTNNWAAVCVGGMTVAALAILGDVDDQYVYEATYMLSDNFRTLVELGLDCYAPDGSYNEGPGYWNYGTNNYFRMAAALDSATGKNYGLMDCWGMDTTCYYACHTEDNDAHYFPFHDGSVGSQDTSYFFYVANYFNDATLYDVRLNQINGNVKSATPIDMIYYPRGVEIDAEAVQLDYYSDTIDLFATRASWERGALFASMIGGNNNVTHGQIDAGDFVYHNGGNIWIYDLGTENYNAPGFWPDATRYRYYVMKPEGNNTVAIVTDPTGVPYGQLLNAVADAYAWGSNEYGAYVTYDMGKTLGSHVSKWERGMLLTNDRKTTVIQDQIAFDSFQTVYWFAHYSKSYVDSVEITEDGRTAYMREDLGGGQYQTLRLSIVSDNKNFKFEIMDTYTFVHTTDRGFSSNHATYSPEDVAQLGTEKEKSRSNYMKLAISSGEALVFNIAVVIELVDESTVGKKNEIDVGYTYDNMSTWVPSADTRGLEVDPEDSIIRRGIPDVNKHLVQSIAKIEAMENQGSLYTTKVKDYYRALTDAQYVVKTLGRELPKEYLSYSETLKEYRDAFTAYRKAISDLQKDQLEFAYKLMGLK